MTRINNDARISHQIWAEFRFGVIGGLLSNPPDKGELCARLKALALSEWKHPISGEKFQISFSTLERWFYASQNQPNDPVGILRRKLRSDFGTTRQMTQEMKTWLQNNYRAHPSWSAQLHYDNLNAWLKQNSDFGMSPSYSTCLRYFKLKGWNRKPRVRSPFAPGRVAAAERLQSHEVRSYEAEYVGGLWHLDFHHGSRQIISSRGDCITPLALCILDDHSRLCCHMQWYLAEDTPCLVHGFIQALQKRGRPRTLMTDNGSAMKSAEFTQGLIRLGIIHEPTLPYSPYQNAKQESFWGHLEGRLMAMLEGEERLTLEDLNRASQAWVEMEYHRSPHTEINEKPLDRFLKDKSVLRDAPDGETLRLAFRRDQSRSQRMSDSTFSLLGKRFEIPAAYRTLPRITVRFAEWDLSRVHLIDPRTQTQLIALYPLDKKKNSNGLRRKLPSTEPQGVVLPKEKPPLLQALMEQYAQSGLPPAYIPGPELSIENSDNQIGVLT